MIADDTYLCANRTDVAAKVVDGEAILINLANGMYYSMDKVGAYVWSILAAGSTLELILQAVSEHYDVPIARLNSELRALVDELHSERLIEAGEGVPAAIPPSIAKGEPYEPPKLIKYEDMADMFALDPPLPELPTAANTGNS